MTVEEPRDDAHHSPRRFGDVEGTVNALLASAEHHAHLDPELYFVPAAERLLTRYRDMMRLPDEGDGTIATWASSPCGVDTRIKASVPDRWARWRTGDAGVERFRLAGLPRCEHSSRRLLSAPDGLCDRRHHRDQGPLEDTRIGQTAAAPGQRAGNCSPVPRHRARRRARGETRIAVGRLDWSKRLACHVGFASAIQAVADEHITPKGLPPVTPEVASSSLVDPATIFRFKHLPC